MTENVGEAEAETEPQSGYDVVIIGGGASGLSAGVFTARYGLDTLILARGRSAIHQCAHLENYLGFPGGISPETFIDLGREHATHEGCTVVEDMGERVERVGERFRVHTQDGRTVGANRLLAAACYDHDYLKPLDNGDLYEDEYTIAADEGGRTAVEDLYVTGWLSSETAHQAIINAGDGARVALSLIEDVRREDEGYWEGVAHYTDWVVEDRRYGGPDWEASMDEWIDESVTEAGDLDSERVERVRREIKAQSLAKQCTDEERDRRAERGRDLLLKHVETRE